MSSILDPEGLAIPILDRSDWNAAPRINAPSYPHDIRESLVVHHTVGLRPKSKSEMLSTIRSLQGFFQNQLGYSDFAYNFIATEWGLVRGRGFSYQNGANTPENSTTFSVVLLGDFRKHRATDAELNAILDLGAYLDLAPAACQGGCGIIGHNSIAPTVCPGPNNDDWIKNGAPRPVPCACR